MIVAQEPYRGLASADDIEDGRRHSKRGRMKIKEVSTDVFFLPLLLKIFPTREEDEDEYLNGFLRDMYEEYLEDGLLGQIYLLWTEILHY